MPRTLAVAAVMIIASGAITLAPRTALADDGAEIAKSNMSRGLTLAEAGRWDEALSAFEEAHRRDPQPTTLFNVAQARLKTKRYRAAVESYQALVAMRSSLPARQAEAADAGLALARGRIGHVTARARGEGALFVDDRPAGNGPIEVDPGPHVVRLAREGHDVGSRHIDVADGQSVEVLVEPDPTATKPLAGPLVEVPPPPAREGGSPVLGMTILGASVVVVGVGAIFAIRGYGEWSDLQDGCGKTRTCDAGDVSSARRDVLVGDVMLGVGIVGIAVGAYLWIASGTAQPPRAAVRF